MSLTVFGGYIGLVLLVTRLRPDLAGRIGLAPASPDGPAPEPAVDATDPGVDPVVDPGVEPSRATVSRQAPLVSVIIPARNEERNIGPLLESLSRVTYANLEVLVVNDHSCDRTVEIATSFPNARILHAPDKPEGWIGKTWACRTGALEARGEILLFTDADTRHAPNSVTLAVADLEHRKLDMLSSVAWQDAPTFWEKLLGPFHMMILAVTAPFETPRPDRLYAIGQYLMFRRDAYDTLGGHESVRYELAEDYEFARRTLETGRRYGVFQGPVLFSVRMFGSFCEFVQGWRRLQGIGLKAIRSWSVLEVFLFFCAFTGGGLFLNRPSSALLLILTAVFTWRTQRRFGDYSIWGVLVSVFPLALFAWTSVLGFYDRFIRKEISWRGRRYPFS